jgi:hypothetical protein
MEIVSYRTVFDLERRIYRVDQLRLNPGGIPLRGIVYFAATVAVALLLAKLPLMSATLGRIPWFLRDLVFPAAVAVLLTIVRIEGRPFHLAALALIRYAGNPRHLSGVRPCPVPGRRWHPEELLVLPDGSDKRLRQLRYRGPGAVLVSAAHIRCEYSASSLGGLLGRPQVSIGALAGMPAPGRGQVIVLRNGARLLVKP